MSQRVKEALTDLLKEREEEMDRKLEDISNRMEEMLKELEAIQ